MSIENDQPKLQHQQPNAPKFEQYTQPGSRDYTTPQADYPDHVEAFDYRQTPLEDAVQSGAIDPNNLPDPDVDELRQPSPFRERSITTPSGLPDYLIPLDEIKKKQWAQRKVAAGTIAVATAGAILGGVIMDKQFDVGDRADNAYPELNPTAAGPLVPGETQPSPQNNLELSSSVTESQARFDSIRGNLPSQIDSELVRLGWGDYNIKTDPIAEASENMTPKQIVDRNFAEGVWVLTNPNKEQAVADASLVAQPSTVLHQAYLDAIEKNQTQADPRAVISSLKFNKGTYSENGLTIESNNLPTILIASTGVLKADNSIVEYQFQKSSDNKSYEWRGVLYINPGDPGWVDPNILETVVINK